MYTNLHQQKQQEKAAEALKTMSTDYSTESLAGTNQEQGVGETETDQNKVFTTLLLILVPSNVAYKVETSLLASLQSLHDIVEQSLGIDPSSCVLIHKGQELREDPEHPERVLENNSAVYIVPAHHPCDSEFITINLQRGRNLSHILQFNSSDKVGRITSAVANQFGVPAEHQTLMYCGGKLPTNKCLRDLHIVHKCTIRLVVNPEYKKQMSKSYMFANPKHEDRVEPEQHLPQIEELAKDVQSIDDIDDEILKEHQERQLEAASADEDCLEEYQFRKRRSTYSSREDCRIPESQDRFCKSERPKIQRSESSTKQVKLGLIEVKEVNSVYNPDDEELERCLEFDHKDGPEVHFTDQPEEKADLPQRVHVNLFGSSRLTQQ